jgi:hypothetical protein
VGTGRRRGPTGCRGVTLRGRRPPGDPALSERELTYSDDAGELLPDVSPDPFDADQARAEPTTATAGRVLAELWERSGPAGELPLRLAVERLREEFGGRFLCGPPGGETIDPRVVEAFARRVGPSVISVPHWRCWRVRRQGERPGRYTELR